MRKTWVGKCSVFHQADDIKLFLSPYDLSDHTFATEAVQTQNVSPEALLELVQFRLTAWASDRYQAFDFISKNGRCMGADKGLLVLKDKLSSAIDAQVVNLDAIYDHTENIKIFLDLQRCSECIICRLS